GQVPHACARHEPSGPAGLVRGGPQGRAAPPHHRPVRDLRRARPGPAGLPDLPVRRRLPGPQRTHHRLRPRRRRRGLRPGGQQPRHRQPGARRRGHRGHLRPLPARLGPALQHAGPVHQALLLHRRPARGRDAGAQPRARLHRRLVPRRGPPGAGRRPLRHRQDLRQRRLRPGRQVHRRPVVRGRRRPLPRGQGRRPDPLDRRPGQPRRHHAAAGRPAGLRSGQRRGDRRLHGPAPRHQLPGAQRRL
ncbi:MAG: hypothetical protein AVDCRST_MAG48-2685, partial [uncultured Friedmanniella sp.]